MAALLADPEYLGAAGRADAPGCRSLVVHDDALGVLDLSSGAALQEKRGHATLLSSEGMVGSACTVSTAMAAPQPAGPIPDLDRRVLTSTIATPRIGCATRANDLTDAYVCRSILS